MKYPQPRARGYHQSQRMTPAQIAASDNLRQRAFASRISRHILARAAGISIGHLNKWMAQSCNLAPDAQASLTTYLDSLA